MKLSELKERVYSEYVNNGYFDFWEKGSLIHSDLAESGMIGSEVGELQEAIFKGEKHKIGSECADIIIRTLNFCTRKKIDIESELKAKSKINDNRGYLHGKRDT